MLKAKLTVDEKLRLIQGFLLAQGRAYKVIDLGARMTELADICQEIREELRGKEKKRAGQRRSR